MLRPLAARVLAALHLAAPLLAIGSFVWFAVLGDYSWATAVLFATLGLFGFLFLGMAAGTAAHALRPPLK